MGEPWHQAPPKYALGTPKSQREDAKFRWGDGNF